MKGFNSLLKFLISVAMAASVGPQNGHTMLACYENIFIIDPVQNAVK